MGAEEGEARGRTRWVRLRAGFDKARAAVSMSLLPALLFLFVLACASDPTPPILRAVEGNDIGRIEELLAKGADVNVQNSDGSSLLHRAAYDGSAELAALLLSKGAEVSASGNGVTPLHYAALKGRVEVIGLLLSHGAAVDPRSRHGNTPLFHASKGGHLAAAKLLLDAGAMPDHKGAGGHSPLHAAAVGGFEELVVALVEAGADVNIVRDDGSTPLRLSEGRGHRGTSQLLELHGAS